MTVLAFTEATVGLILVAMLISYLPTMYSAFSKRETAVSQLEVRAGSPPTAAELVWRMHMLLQTETYPHFPADPSSVTRAEFDAAYDRLALQGVPLKPDAIWPGTTLLAGVSTTTAFCKPLPN